MSLYTDGLAFLFKLGEKLLQKDIKSHLELIPVKEIKMWIGNTCKNSGL
jgi:hypothetical protein